MNAAGAPCYHMNTGKFKRGLSYILYQDLHWLNVPELIQFRVTATVYRCLHNMALRYLTETVCQHVVSVFSQPPLET